MRQTERKRFTTRNVPIQEPGEYRDALVPDLILRVTETSKSWGFRYTLHGERRRENLGDVELDPDKLAKNIEDARDLARALSAGLVRGEDPRITLRRHSADSITVETLCAQMIEGAVLRDSTRKQWRLIFKRHIKDSTIGAIASPLLVRDHVEDWGADIVDASGGYSANRAFEIVRRAFSWGIEKRLLVASPFVGIKPPFSEERGRGRFLSVEELRRLMRCLRETPACGHVDAVLLMLYTAKRRSQIETSRVKEWHLDDKPSMWIAPSENMGSKGAPDEVVALSSQAEAVARRMMKYRRPWLFPSFKTGGHGEVTHDFVALLRRAVGAEKHWTIHCLRATFATHAQERFRADLSLIAACLGQVPTGIPESTRAYALSHRLEEKRDLLQKWADWIDSLAAEAEDRPDTLVKDAARFLGVTESYLGNLRFKKRGPRYRVILQRVWYWMKDLEAWKRERETASRGPQVAQDANRESAA